jgi:hypothetical protein
MIADERSTARGVYCGDTVWFHEMLPGTSRRGRYTEHCSKGASTAMARENQGLHAALIVFVVLTILLAVSTFVIQSVRDANERAARRATRRRTDPPATGQDRTSLK